MTHLGFAILLLALATLVPDAAGQKPQPGPAANREENPLPKGATARLGLHVFRGQTMYGLVFSPDGTTLRAVNESGRMIGWDAATGLPRPTVDFKLDKEDTPTTGAVAGDRVIWIQTPRGFGAKAQDSTAVVYSLATGKEVSRFTFASRLPGFNIFALATYNVSLSPDGRYFAAVVNEGRGVDVYDLDTGLLLHALKATSGQRVHVGEDCRTLYFTDNGRWRRCDLATGKELTTVTDADDWIDLVRASPDGKRFVTRGRSRVMDENQKFIGVAPDRLLVVRDVVANRTAGKLDVGAAVWDFRFLGPDSLLVLVYKYHEGASVPTLSRWNTTTLKRDWEVPASGGPSWLAVSPDGRQFAATDRSCIAVLYDAATGKPIEGQEAHASAVAWVGFTPDGGHVVTAAQDGTRTWTLKGELKQTTASPEFARGRFQSGFVGEHPVWAAHTGDGEKAELVRWDHAKGAFGWRMPLAGPPPVRLLTADGKRCVGFAADKGDKSGRLSEVTVYDGPAGKVLHSWPIPDLAANGTPLALAPAGDVLYVARGTERDEGAVRIVGLDVTNGKETVRIDAGQFSRWYIGNGPFPLAVSPDGLKVALVAQYPRSSNYGLLVFDIKSGKKLAERDIGRSHLPALRFSPDGKRLVVRNVWGPAILLCDADSGTTPSRKLEYGRNVATAVGFSADGASLAVGYQHGTALVWDLAAK